MIDGAFLFFTYDIILFALVVFAFVETLQTSFSYCSSNNNNNNNTSNNCLFHG